MLVAETLSGHDPPPGHTVSVKGHYATEVWQWLARRPWQSHERQLCSLAKQFVQVKHGDATGRCLVRVYWEDAANRRSPCKAVKDIFILPCKTLDTTHAHTVWSPGICDAWSAHAVLNEQDMI